MNSTNVAVERIAPQQTAAESEEAKPPIWKRAWRIWMKFAEISGTIQMMVILSLLYVLMVSWMSVPFKFIADPLGFRKRRPSWTSREPAAASIESMKNQF